MNKIFTVIKREYIRAIFNPKFVILTLLFPIIYLALIFFSSYSSQEAANNIQEQVKNLGNIQVLDEAGIISKDNPQIQFIADKQQGINDVKDNKNKLFIYYPKDFVSTKNIEIYMENKNISDASSYQSFASSLIKSSILKSLNDPVKENLYGSSYNFEVVKYKNGEIDTKANSIIVLGILGVVIYFMMLIFGNMWMLTSISEEKENRMMEIVLTSVKSGQFITGKIVGNLLIVITQILLALLLPLVLIFVSGGKFMDISIDVSSFNIGFYNIFLILFYVIVGFLFYSGIMVSMGALATNQKEASQSSGIFMFLGMIPIYASYMIATNPTGSLAMFFSYFPFTAPMVLLFRNLVGELSSMEFILSTVLILIYMIISFWFASRMFEMGALEYNKKLGLKGIFRRN